MLGWINLDSGQLRKIKEMFVKMNKTKKSNRNESCMSSPFLVYLFSSNDKLGCWQWCWRKCITDIGTKRFFGKQTSYNISQKISCLQETIYIEPVHRWGKLGSKWQKIENSWKGLQKADRRKKTLTLKLCVQERKHSGFKI